MAEFEQHLTLSRVRATSYRHDGERFLIQLRGTGPTGARVDGIGESSPRGFRTGDRRPGSWEFLGLCLRQLEGRSLAVPDAAAALAGIRTIISEFEALAPEHERLAAQQEALNREVTPPQVSLRRALRQTLVRSLRQIQRRVQQPIPAKPYKGTLAGLEEALLDLASNALGQRLTGAPRPTSLTEPSQYCAAFERVLNNDVDYVAHPTPPGPTYEGKTANVYAEVAYLKPLGADGAKGSILEREALMRGLSTTRFSKGAFVASDGVHPPLSLRWSRSPRSSAVSLGLCTHKEATRLRLQQAGVPVPDGRTFGNGDHDSAQAFADRIGYPVVVKPAMGVRGIGVVANITGPKDLRRAFRQFEGSRFGDDDFIVEKHVRGRDYRIVVIGEEVIAAVLREPASVEGDGEHTVAELIVNKNAVRRLNPHLLSRLIKYDDAARHQLQLAGLTLDTVLAPGQRLLLSDSCSLSQGGDSIDVLDELHPTIKDACVRAVKAIPGMWYCGVDFLIEDHTVPLAEQEAGICELNAHAAISNCEYPLYGTPRPVARPFIEQCIEHFGLIVNDKPAERLSLRLTVRGRVSRVGYRLWMRRHARAFGIAGWVRSLDQETIEAVLTGDTVPVAALAAAAIRGSRRARPVSVHSEHIEPPTVSDFEIRWDKPMERNDAE